MNGAVMFLIGTLLAWIGWIALLRAAYLGVRLLVKAPGMDREGTRKGLALALVAGGAMLLGAAGLPMDLGRPAREGGWSIPLVWVLAPFTFWMIVASLVMVAARLLQTSLAVEAAERRERFLQAGAWLLCLVAFGWAHARWGSAPQVFRGAVSLSPGALAGLLALAFGTVGVFAATSRAAVSRGWSKVAAAHVALIAGSVVFAIPFLWLLVTSFKEDRDIATTDGLRFIPYVSEVAPFYDPDDRMFQGRLQGITVVGSRVSVNRDGTYTIDVIRPGAMRGRTLVAHAAELREVPKEAPVVTVERDGQTILGKVVEELPDGRRRIRVMEPEAMKGAEVLSTMAEAQPVRRVGLRIQNYPGALEFLPPETNMGLTYLQNTLILVVLNVIGTLISCAIVAYAFARMRWPGRDVLFLVVLSTMMLPGAVTLLPNFLIWRELGAIDTLYPLWVGAFFAGAFNVFLLRQFFLTIPMELEDAAKIDGCTYFRTFWQVMLPQIKPALAVIAIWTTMGTWNNFMGPLIFINSPENMPIAYAVQLFQSERGGEAGLMMAFATMAMLPILALFFFAQKYFIEGVALTGLGGR
jgi:multiple sugar transport system permease protein